LLTYALPTYAVQAPLELAHAYCTLDDVAGARAALRQAGDVLRLRPDLGTLPAQVQELRSRLDSAPGGRSRVLVADHRSIYRKLGASSRSEAVQRVQAVGLLGS
jgi:LuxR family maltose regulon positive regulatory protein